jgi:hypothetical protein
MQTSESHRFMPLSMPHLYPSFYRAEAPYIPSQQCTETTIKPTYSNNINELVGNDGLTTSVVLKLERTNHIECVLSAIISENLGIAVLPTFEAFSMAVLLAEISAA